MRCGGKRLIGLLLSVLLILGAVPIGALAAGEVGYSVMLENRERPEGGSPGVNLAKTFGASSVTYDGGDLYSQLTTRQKACYDALKAVTIDRLLSAAQVQIGKLSYRRIVLHISGMDGLSMTGTFSNGQFLPSGSSKTVESGIYTDLCAAIVALRYDHPEILWIGNLYYGYRVLQEGGSIKTSGVTLNYHLEYEGREKAMQAQMLSGAQAIAAQAAKAPDTYQKVKAVHDLLARGCTYGDVNQPLSHTAYSALVTGDSYQPVCDGYSKAFKIVCDLLEIPCVTPSSNDHMWNNVKMDDGEWYNVDLTWDDDDTGSARDAGEAGDAEGEGTEGAGTGEGEGEETEDPAKDPPVATDYFLVGSQTVIDGEPFSKQEYHVEKNPYNDYLESDKSGALRPVTLRYPTKNKTAYEYLGKDYPPLTYPDVKRSAWYYEAVEAVSQKGLFQGDKNGLFLPGKNITRAEFTLVIAKALNADLSRYGGNSFTDVPQGKWYSAAIGWAKETGLIKGYKDGSFHPDSPITRQEMCLVLFNALEAQPSTSSFRFPDDSSISKWAKSAVYACYDLGLVVGNEKGYFSPKSNTLRSQAASIFSRATLPERPAPEEPDPNEPTPDEPGTDEPSTDEPGTDEPSTDQPGTDEPTVDQPAA